MRVAPRGVGRISPSLAGHVKSGTQQSGCLCSLPRPCQAVLLLEKLVTGIGWARLVSVGFSSSLPSLSPLRSAVSTALWALQSLEGNTWQGQSSAGILWVTALATGSKRHLASFRNCCCSC